MVSKKEILEAKHAARVMNWGKVFLQNPSIIESAYEAMDEYAKQQSIAFRNWEPPIGNYNSDEDLYEIFEQQKSK